MVTVAHICKISSLDTPNQMFIEDKNLIFDILEHFGWLILLVPPPPKKRGGRKQELRVLNYQLKFHD